MILKSIRIETVFGKANFILKNRMIIKDVISEIFRFRYFRKEDISRDCGSLETKIQFLSQRKNHKY